MHPRGSSRGLLACLGGHCRVAQADPQGFAGVSIGGEGHKCPSLLATCGSTGVGKYWRGGKGVLRTTVCLCDTLEWCMAQNRPVHLRRDIDIGRPELRGRNAIRRPNQLQCWP